MSYAESLKRLQRNGWTGAFRDGDYKVTDHRQAGQSGDVINAHDQGSASGSYAARGGETLADVARLLWGDANLWYRIGQANGLTAGATLFEGQRLTIPAGVTRSANAATSFAPYDPSLAIGEVSASEALNPTSAVPRGRRNKCGALGAVLVAAVAVAAAVHFGPAAVAGIKGLFGAAAVATVTVGGATTLTATAAAIGTFSGIAGGALAGEATRSIATGTSFGDNVLAVLPDVIGQTIGRVVGATVAVAVERRALPRAKATTTATDPRLDIDVAALLTDDSVTGGDVAARAAVAVATSGATSRKKPAPRGTITIEEVPVFQGGPQAGQAVTADVEYAPYVEPYLLTDSQGRPVLDAHGNQKFGRYLGRPNQDAIWEDHGTEADYRARQLQNAVNSLLYGGRLVAFDIGGGIYDVGAGLVGTGVALGDILGGGDRAVARIAGITQGIGSAIDDPMSVVRGRLRPLEQMFMDGSIRGLTSHTLSSAIGGFGTGALLPQRFGARAFAAESAALRQTGSGTILGSADEAYDAIRASTTDVGSIAGNTGYKASNIQKVKDHLFMNEQLLDRYESLGVPATRARFDSDIGIAGSWARLERGTHGPADLMLLRHETAEAWYMRNVSPGYNAAHNAAQRRFPAPGF